MHKSNTFGTVEDWTEYSQTQRHTKVKTVYPPLRSLGRYNYMNFTSTLLAMNNFQLQLTLFS